MPGGSQTRDTFALCAPVSRATSKLMSWRTSPPGFCATLSGFWAHPSGLSTRSVTRTEPQALTSPKRRTLEGSAVSGCPAGHRFTRSPRHRSAKRVGVGGKKTFMPMWCPVEDTDLPPRMAPRSAGVRHDGFLTARRRAHEKARRDAGSTAGLGNKKSGGGLLVPPL